MLRKLLAWVSHGHYEQGNVPFDRDVRARIDYCKLVHGNVFEIDRVDYPANDNHRAEANDCLPIAEV